jgi:hypothetical protein
MTAQEVVELLGLEPLPGEGGMWTQTWRDDHGTAIYFLLSPEDFSAMHRLDGPEVWHHYAGAPVDLVLLGASIRRPRLGDDLAAGERPCVVIPAGVWMGAATTGEWSLVGTTMAPPWEPYRFELAERNRLSADFPEAVEDIRRLTREPA